MLAWESHLYRLSNGWIKGVNKPYGPTLLVINLTKHKLITYFTNLTQLLPPVIT